MSLAGRLRSFQKAIVGDVSSERPSTGGGPVDGAAAWREPGACKGVG